jgi:hypothetical protein
MMMQLKNQLSLFNEKKEDKLMTPQSRFYVPFCILKEISFLGFGFSIASFYLVKGR